MVPIWPPPPPEPWTVATYFVSICLPQPARQQVKARRNLIVFMEYAMKTMRFLLALTCCLAGCGKQIETKYVATVQGSGGGGGQMGTINGGGGAGLQCGDHLEMLDV